MNWTQARRAIIAVTSSIVFVGAALGPTVLSSVPAGAQTTIGNAAFTNTCNPTAGNSESWIQTGTSGTSYTVPAGGGTVASWSVDGTAGQVAYFEVWRPEGSGNYTLVYITPSPGETLSGGVQTFTRSPAPEVDGGDLIGLGLVDNGGACLNQTSNGADAISLFFLPLNPSQPQLPQQGNTYSVLESFPGFQVNVAATVDPPTASCSVTQTGTDQLQATATVNGGTATAFAWTDTGGSPGTGTGNPFSFSVPGPGSYSAQVTATVGGVPIESSSCTFTIPAAAAAITALPAFTG